MTRPAPERRIFRIATALGLLGLTGLAAAGEFRAALALTLGAAVAIFAGVWLSDVAGKLLVPRTQMTNKLDAKFTLRALLRYVVLGFALWAAVRWVPDQLPWLCAGLSAVVVAVVVEGILELGGIVEGRPGKPGPGPTSG